MLLGLVRLIVIVWTAIAFWFAYRIPQLIPILFFIWAAGVIPVTLVGMLFRRRA